LAIQHLAVREGDNANLASAVVVQSAGQIHAV
jgi:hypothetical protein